LTARSEADLATVAEAVQSRGGRAVIAPADVADEAQVAVIGGRIQRQRGRLDVLVASAGVGIYGPLATAPIADLDRSLAVNVRGTLLCCQQAVALMRPQRQGYCIGIASVMAVTAYRNQGAYAASKHAMLGLMKALAKESQPDGIRVSVICPGGVDTEMAGLSRPDLDRSTLMTVADVAQSVQYLLSLSDRVAVDQLNLRRRGAEPFA
jgi:3-oxoacyl-[acyl-carrier protein] reductase